MLACDGFDPDVMNEGGIKVEEKRFECFNMDGSALDSNVVGEMETGTLQDNDKFAMFDEFAYDGDTVEDDMENARKPASVLQSPRKRRKTEDSAVHRGRLLMNQYIEVWRDSQNTYCPCRVVDVNERGIVTGIFATSSKEEVAELDLDIEKWKDCEPKIEIDDDNDPLLMDVSKPSVGKVLVKVKQTKEQVNHTITDDKGQRDVLELPSLQKLSNLLEKIFDFQDQLGGSVPLESKDITVLQRELSKNRNSGLLHQIEPRTFCRVLELLDVTIVESQRGAWGEDNHDSIICGFQAAVAACMIMSLPDMPKQVYQEDVVKTSVALLRHQLTKTVYPLYHPDVLNSENEVSSKKRKSVDGSANRRRSSSARTVSKSLLRLYSVVCELVDVLAEVLQIDSASLEDSIVLDLSESVVGTFFREGNLKELQARAMNVIRIVFANYPTHQQVILDDILHQLSKLPNNKRNACTFKVVGVEIQVITALLVQLVQSSTSAVHKKAVSSRDSEVGPMQFRQAYDASDNISKVFLNTIIERCTIKRDDGDLKSILSTLTADLLSIMLSPEWPASERIVSILTRQLLLKSRRGAAPLVRSFCLELLGKIAAKIRKLEMDKGNKCDEIESQIASENSTKCETSSQSSEWNTIGNIDSVFRSSTHEFIEAQSTGQNTDLTTATHKIQDLLLDHLDANAAADPGVLYARNYFICRWIHSEHVQINANDQVEAGLDEAEEHRAAAVESRCTELTERMKNGFVVDTMISSTPVLSSEQAMQTIQLLSVGKQYDAMFSTILGHIIAAFKEKETPIRSKALKALATIIDEDCIVLSTASVKQAVEERFTDMASSVREAAVELVGKYVLLRPDLTKQYYRNFIQRLRDKGASVRKRCIQVLRDVCVQQPTFPHVKEICSEILRRVVVDESDSIRSLAMKSCEQIWFTKPLVSGSDNTQVANEREVKLFRIRVKCIIDVLCQANSERFFVQLIEKLLNNPSVTMMDTCRALVKSALLQVLNIEERFGPTRSRQYTKMVRDNLRLLFVFCKAAPTLLVPHAETLSPYLEFAVSAPDTKDDVNWIQYYTASILSCTVPLTHHPSSTFLKSLEEACVKGILVATSRSVVEECVKCLSGCVQHTNNIEIAKDTLCDFYEYLRDEVEGRNFNKNRPKLLRSLFASGLMCRYFDFMDLEEATEHEDSLEEDKPLREDCIPHIVFWALVEFASSSSYDVQIRKHSLVGLGHVFVHYPRLMIRTEMIDLYVGIMDGSDIILKQQVLVNMQNVLQYEQQQMEEKQKAQAKGEGDASNDITEIGNADSGISGIMLVRLQPYIRSSIVSGSQELRDAAFLVLRATLRQGLIHPMECVSSLIALSTELKLETKNMAQQQLKIVNDSFHNLVVQKAVEGSRLAYKFQQRLLRGDAKAHASGFRNLDATHPSAALASIYNLVRVKKPSLRNYIGGILKLFVAETVDVKELAFFAENLTAFPFETVEEPLYLINQMNSIAAINGNALESDFRGLLGLSESFSASEDEDNEQLNDHKFSVTEDLKIICARTQGISLLLQVKQYLQRVNGFTEARCEDYSPSDPSKSNNMKVNRRPVSSIKVSEIIRPCDSASDIVAHFHAYKSALLQGEYAPFEGESDNCYDGVQPSEPVKTIQRENNGSFSKPVGGSRRQSSSKSKSSSRRQSKDSKRKNSEKKTKRRKKIGESDEDNSDDPDWE